MSYELKQNLLDLIQSAIDLANSVRDDVKERQTISNKTILLLNEFKLKHDNLDTILDVVNGIN